MDVDGLDVLIAKTLNFVLPLLFVKVDNPISLVREYVGGGQGSVLSKVTDSSPGKNEPAFHSNDGVRA
jgi:hypothetical protein